METVQTENRSFVRDIHSKALLNTDRIALENHRQSIRNTVKEEMLEIKILLQELLHKKEL